MPSLLLLLAGPFQSWGARSVFAADRDTSTVPTKSGLLGMLSAGAGIGRGETRWDATDAQLLVRVDRAGTVVSDFHTVGSADEPILTVGGTARHGDTLLTRRHYVSDAVFVAALTHSDPGLVAEWAQAAETPRWPLFLGRGSCLPAYPVFLAAGPSLNEWLVDTAPLLREPTGGSADAAVTIVHDAADAGLATTVIADDPFPTNPRQFRERRIAATEIRVGTERCIGSTAAAVLALRDAARDIAAPREVAR